MNKITYVGLDTHKNSIQVCMLLPQSQDRVEWNLPNTPEDIRKMARTLKRRSEGSLQVCYEAGPLGFSLQRQLLALDIPCEVIAPTTIPHRSGDKVKTDRLDAFRLARWHSHQEMSIVHPPTLEQEAVRDLCRCRISAKKDQTRARHRVAKFLTRHGHRYDDGKRAWTQQYYGWLQRQHFDQSATQTAFDSYLLSVVGLDERVKSLELAMGNIAEQPFYQTMVGYLRCFRGINTVTALSLAAELYSIERFPKARNLMDFVGLVPGESSTGEDERRLPITKRGNSVVRHLLVEAAWHYRHPPQASVTLRERRQGQPGWAVAISERASNRLHRRYRALVARHKHPNKVVAALARELAGFIWEMMIQAHLETRS